MKKLFLDDLWTLDMVYDPTCISKFEVVRSQHVLWIGFIKGYSPFIKFNKDLD